jgi:hypothetical protein
MDKYNAYAMKQSITLGLIAGGMTLLYSLLIYLTVN